MKAHALLLFFALLFSHFLSAEMGSPNEYLTLETPRAVKVAVGKKGQAILEATVSKGFHIQANPASMPNLIPTELTLTPVGGLQLGQPIYPPSKPWKLAGTDRKVATFDGKIAIRLPLNAAKATPGNYELKGTLRYQACNEKNCFFPIKAPVTIPVQVTK